MPIMTLKDVEQVQTAFSEAGLDYDVELTSYSLRLCASACSRSVP
ncbi:hypothetical protein [Aphanizomenon sp. CS-733/32]|nr:hypothetical protein [Aphanizomenon sp. CS-733/32]